MQAYYQMSYVDRRITDAETVLCEDTAQFTRGLADVTGEMTTSVVDAVFYCLRLKSYLGTHAYTLAMASYIFAAGALTTALAPNFSRLVRRTQELEGGYKASQVHVQCSTVRCLDRTIRDLLGPFFWVADKTIPGGL